MYQIVILSKLSIILEELILRRFRVLKYKAYFDTNSVSLFFFKMLYCIFYSSYDIFIRQCFRSNWEIKALCEKIGFEFWIFKFLISLGKKFQLKLTIFMCWTKFPEKACFPSKTEKKNSTIEFCIFELNLVLNLS